MQSIHTSQKTQKNRRGIAVLWLILWGSMFLTFFCVTLEFASLWHAQVELNNTMDSAALAAARQWGASGSDATLLARNVGVAYVDANPVLGATVPFSTNYGPGNPPNQNATTSGNLVFGALDSTVSPITFNSNGQGGCAAGDVTITITKPSAGADVTPDEIEVIFNDGGANLEIQSIAFTLPTSGVNNVTQRPYFNSGQNPAVSQTVGDYQGLDPAPSSGGMNPDWDCPNGNGDICFAFEDLVAGQAGRYQTVRLNFAPGSFTSTGVPATTDYFHFGVSTNNLNPPAFSGSNDGDAWGADGVIATITFYNSVSMTTSTASSVFVNTGGDDGISQAFFTGAGGGLPAVIAQATMPVQGFCSSLFGVSFFNVSASATAYYDCGTGRSALVHITNYVFP